MDVVAGDHIDVVHSLTDVPLPFPDSSFDLVYMSHVLEHVPWFLTVRILSDMRRLLRNGGVLEVWVPDLAKLVRGYLEPSVIGNDGWWKHNEGHHPVTWFNGRLFSYGPPGRNWHRAVFDRTYLAECLLAAGFSTLVRVERPRGCDHGWINLGMGARK